MNEELPVTLADIEQAAERLAGVAVHTPLLNSPELDERAGARVYYKAESLQHIGAFKFRGAYNRLAQLDAAARERGVVAYSSGNHAQGVAYAARLLDIPATIVMPRDAPEIKLEGTRRLGAEVLLYDRHSESREEIAARRAEDSGATLVPAFDDLDIIAGQGTVGLELMHQLADVGQLPNKVLSPVGGGGLLSGVAVAVHSLHPGVELYGVEPEEYDDHLRSRLAGERVRIAGDSPTLCDALMATTPGEITWSMTGNLVRDFLKVSEEEVMHAVSFAFRALKLVVEPGGAVALAAVLQGRVNSKGDCLALILSGGNIDPGTFNRCLERFPSP